MLSYRNSSRDMREPSNNGRKKIASERNQLKTIKKSGEDG
jgi:hypothetical protein